MDKLRSGNFFETGQVWGRRCDLCVYVCVCACARVRACVSVFDGFSLEWLDQVARSLDTIIRR